VETKLNCLQKFIFHIKVKKYFHVNFKTVRVNMNE
jgi:hypothetical protein